MDREHRRTSTNLKRSYDTMPAAAPDAPPSFLDFSANSASRAPHDDHYHNPEHQPQRRRVESPFHHHHHHHQPAQHQHYPGDGYDFRRPVMSANGWDLNTAAPRTGHEAADTIDLTDDVHDLAWPRPHHMALPRIQSVAPAEAPGPSSRATQRLPRFERNIIDLADSDEEEQPQQQAQQQWPRHQQAWGDMNLQDDDEADSLFIPLDNNPPVQQARPTTAGLRRPGFVRQLSPAGQLDEVEVVGSRPLSRQPSRRQTPNMFTRNATPNLANNPNTAIDLTADDDDDVIHTDTRPVPGINGDRPAMAGSGIGTRDRATGLGFGHMGIGRLAQHLRGRNAAAAAAVLAQHNDYANLNNADSAARAHAAQHNYEVLRQHRQDLHDRVERTRSQRGPARRPVARTAQAMPNVLDYDVVAFNMGFAGAARPPTPPYEPPTKAEKGFTRSPEEDEEVVCPNCGDELAVGKDELKQQVWVIKTCGHAYCGECATRTRPQNRSKGKGKATDPSTPPPLKKCVVVGCEKGATKSQMVHVYMST